VAGAEVNFATGRVRVRLARQMPVAEREAAARRS